MFRRDTGNAVCQNSERVRQGESLATIGGIPVEGTMTQVAAHNVAMDGGHVQEAINAGFNNGG
jgi:hypothetical protein